jgi:hypothetical protein
LGGVRGFKFSTASAEPLHCNQKTVRAEGLLPFKGLTPLAAHYTC